jgi:hypothetical protein
MCSTLNYPDGYRHTCLKTVFSEHMFLKGFRFMNDCKHVSYRKNGKVFVSVKKFSELTVLTFILFLCFCSAC